MNTVDPMNDTGVVVFSGGLDSTTLLYHVLEKIGPSDIDLLTFKYGQSHSIEQEHAESIAEDLGLKEDHRIVDIGDVNKLIGGSSLTDDEVELPKGEYDKETMQKTVVPNRNAIMLSIAFGLCASEGHDFVATATHGGDHYLYPDCRPDFLKSFEEMEQESLGPIWGPKTLYTPFKELPKSGIVKLGDRLNVPFGETYSCYDGDEIHCGECGTCRERKEAFEEAEVNDPTEYKN